VKEPNISIVICTYNRADLLRIALESLIRQKTEGEFDYEVVVVDDRSSDQTPEVVAEFAARSPVPVRYVRAEGEGVARARNRGVEEARGEWVAYTDDDQWNDQDWLYELVMAARKAGVDCVGGVVELQLPTEASLPLTPVTESILGRKINPEGLIRHLMDCPGTGNVMFKRSVFDTVGLFDNALAWGGEDADFMLRVLNAGIPVWFTPTSIVHHMISPYRVTEIYFRWASLRVGVALAEVDAKVRGRANLALRCVARIGQALLINIPQLIRASLARDAGRVLEYKCLLWRVVSYTRQTVHLLAPRAFKQERFFSSLKFRGERTTVGKSK